MADKENTINVPPKAVPASFRDPAGFVFRNQGILYRQVNKGYHEPYQLLMESGLYSTLRDQGMLVIHEEVEGPVAEPNSAWRILP